MTFDDLMELVGEANFLGLGGFAIGIAFGVLSQRSRFCLRAATLEVAHGRIGERLAIWLFAFSAALICTQLLIVFGLFDTGEVRQLNNAGSLSGSIIGGLLFGSGMVLTRACASRMVVLASTGNLRALMSGLVFAVAAQAFRFGTLAPVTQTLDGLWTISGNDRSLLSLFRLGHGGAVLVGGAWLLGGLAIAVYRRASPAACLTAAGVGGSVALAWWFNYAAAAGVFDVPAPVHALSFTGPSSDVLMYLLSPPGGKLTFDLGLIPGVALGSFLSAAVRRELVLEGFHDGASMRRYILGGLFMGLGSVMAGGCAVGAGVSGASVFGVTAWLVLWSMWIGAVVTDRLVDREPDLARG